MLIDVNSGVDKGIVELYSKAQETMHPLKMLNSVLLYHYSKQFKNGVSHEDIIKSMENCHKLNLEYFANIIEDKLLMELI